MIKNMEKVTQTSAQEVYFRIKVRINEVLKQIWEADERGENFTHLHEELVLLESLLKNK
jgi:hypothetical protein